MKNKFDGREYKRIHAGMNDEQKVATLISITKEKIAVLTAELFAQKEVLIVLEQTPKDE